MRRAGPCFVYFARRADGVGPVKIGCSMYPAQRVVGLIPGHRCEVLATIPGAEDLERRFHARFEADFEYGEWFAGTPDLLGVIASLAAGSFDVDSLPPPKWVRPPNRKGAKWSDHQRQAFAASMASRRAR